MATLASMRASLSAAARQWRTRAAPFATKLQSTASLGVRRWGSACIIGTGVYFYAVSPESRRSFWANVRASSFDPLREWSENRTQGARKRALLAHFGATRGGDILELMPGAGGASFGCLDALADTTTLASSRPSFWKGIGIDDANWRRGQIQQKAEMHCGLPSSLLEFDSCSKRQLSLIQLLREIPDNSIGFVFALQGLSPLFHSSPLTHAALSNESARITAEGPPLPPPTREAELAVVLHEIHRILRPGGKFLFMDSNAHNREDGFNRSVQEVIHALKGALTPAGLAVATRTPIELAQQLPLVGFNELHVEQWPNWVDTNNSRRGVRILRTGPAGNAATDPLYTPVEGLEGSSPLIAGVAVKSSRPQPIVARTPEKRIGSIFTT